MAPSLPPSSAILDGLEEPALVVAGGRVTAANSAARRLLGSQLTAYDVRLAIRHPLALDTILAGQAAEIELVGIGTADRPWLLRVRPIGEDMVLVRLSDRAPLRSAERMRTDFVANASHELRTPLATIIGYAETLAEAGPVDEAIRTRFGSTIESEARRMLRIVEDLMSLSRIEADRYRVPAESVTLADIVSLAVEQAAPLAERRGCRIQVDLAPGLPAIAGDFAQLLQLADNLLGNALRYGCNEKACLVTVAVERTDGRLNLTVTDRGDGIAAEHLPRLTERFYRVDSARSRETGGTGLGLAIVKHIVERHRGTLDIRSTPGNGTTVSASFPID